MPLVECKCTNCGAVLKVDSAHDAAVCEFCKTPFIVQKAINNYNNINNISDSVVNIFGGNSQEKENLIKRMFMFVEEGKQAQAIEYSERVLDMDPECAEAYLCKLLVGLNVRQVSDLEKLPKPFDRNENYLKVIKYSDELGKKVKQANNTVIKEYVYNKAMNLTHIAVKDSTPHFVIKRNEEAIKLFESIIDWKDSRAKIDECNKKIEDIRIATEKTKARNRKIAMIGGPIVAVLIVFLIVLNAVVIPKQKLNKAMAQLNAGNYDEAYFQLAELGKSYTINGSKYDRAIELAEKGEYEAAIVMLKQISDYKDADSKLESCYIGKYGEKNWEIIKPIVFAKEGDTIVFGRYEQDNNTKNGKEEIEWLVLAKEDNKILVISEYALDFQPYNTEDTSVTWKTCSLRKWLNDTFFKSAFSKEEQNLIFEGIVTADDNPKYNSNPGVYFYDKIFLLSITEAEKNFGNDEDRKCIPSAYAIEQGARTSQNHFKDDKATCWWWLRSPGNMETTAANVEWGGNISTVGTFVHSGFLLGCGCVRPALWIEI